MDLSVVTSTFNSGIFIKEFIERINNIINNNKLTAEIIIVDDGSTDNSLNLLVDLAKQNSNIKVIELSRNFGHHNALLCGLENSIGELIFLIDGDLEEEPEDFYTFYKILNLNKLDMVFGTQSKRRGNLIEKISGNIYYLFLNYILKVKIPFNIATSRLMTRKYLNSFLLFKESLVVISGLTKLAGFKIDSIEIQKKRRRKSTYNLSKKIQILIRSITNYSAVPLYLVFYSGLVISFFALITIIFVIANSFFNQITVPGWLSLFCISWLGIGLTLLSNGLIAIYLKTIFIEVKNRPRTIIRNIYQY